jgi:hypothetical protein
MVGPAGFRGLGSYFSPLFLGHGLEPTLPTDLTTFAAHGGHVCGEVYGGSGIFGDDNLLGWFSRGTIYNPLGQLVWIARAFSFSDCHDAIFVLAASRM